MCCNTRQAGWQKKQVYMAYHGVNLCLRTLVKYILLIQDYPEDPRAFGPRALRSYKT
uniref:Uncharacterized protein n=2 Tax=Anguilla anguilla TaxID=7936 RepID=A0A0E9RYM7_ANGAN